MVGTASLPLVVGICSTHGVISWTRSVEISWVGTGIAR